LGASDVPLVSPNDTIEVFFLRAPLLESSLNTTMMGAFNAFHSGVGFSASNGSTWQFEYDAQHFIGALFPEVADLTIKWDNAAEVCMTPFLRKTYWKLALLVHTITGAQYNSLADTIGGYSAKHPLYQTFTVYNSAEQLPYHQADTCSDFTWTLFSTMKALGFPRGLGPIIPPATSQFALFGNSSVPPKTVKMWNPIERLKVLEFYELLHNTYQSFTTEKIGGGIFDALLFLWQFHERHEFYVFVDANTYLEVSLNRTTPLAVRVNDPYRIFS